jgi:hypothetical protein
LAGYFDPRAFAELLAEELEERIEDTIENIGYMNNTEEDAIIDERLQYTQYWRERGAAVVQEYADRQEPFGPAGEQAFLEWKRDPGPTCTVPKLRKWKAHATALRRSANASHVLSRYWAIQNMFIELEDDVRRALFKFDDEHG